MAAENDEQAVLAQERRALDQWSQGHPGGYGDSDADDITYFDDIGAQTRLDGRAAVRDYLTGLAGKIPEHRYDIVNPKVQAYGDVAILTLLYRTFTPDGNPLTPWKATCVYRRMADGWRRVHAHWSMLKES
jgi:ketosteroid isomerase-like protein